MWNMAAASGKLVMGQVPSWSTHGSKSVATAKEAFMNSISGRATTAPTHEVTIKGFDLHHNFRTVLV